MTATLQVRYCRCPRREPIGADRRADCVWASRACYRRWQRAQGAPSRDKGVTRRVGGPQISANAAIGAAVAALREFGIDGTVATQAARTHVRRRLSPSNLARFKAQEARRG